MEGMSQEARVLAEGADELRPVPAMPQRGYAIRVAAGVPFLLLAITPLLAFPSDTVFRAFVLTGIAIFTVHMPVIACLFGLNVDEQAEVALPRAAYLGLLLLWATTDWALCLLWR
jgi:hypothetical protein